MLCYKLGYVSLTCCCVWQVVWVPLLHVTLPLSQTISGHSFNCPVNKAKRPKNIENKCHWEIFNYVPVESLDMD